jgi:hypothetical protein
MGRIDTTHVALALLCVALVGLMVASRWRIHQKAGQPGWSALVPVYSSYVLIVKICGLPPVWFWLLLVPIVDIAVGAVLVVILPFKLAQKFGQDFGVGLCLLLLPLIYYPLLAFSGAEYQWDWQRASPDSRAGRDGARPWKRRTGVDGKPWKRQAGREDDR